jgi:hypothetical protein
MNSFFTDLEINTNVFNIIADTIHLFYAVFFRM